MQSTSRNLAKAARVVSTSARVASTAPSPVEPLIKPAAKNGKKAKKEVELPVQKIMSKQVKDPKPAANLDPAPTKSSSTTDALETGLQVQPFDFSQSYKRDDPQEDGLTAGGLPLPSSSRWAIPHIRHPFNTHAFVDRLVQSTFTRTSAETLMQTARNALIVEESKVARDLVAKADLDNEAYLFRAALDELKTEVQVAARNDGITLRSANSLLEREVESFSQKLREDVHDLKNNIQLEFNNRKEEGTADQKALELRIIDTNNKLSIQIGDFRSELEVKKWKETRRCLLLLVGGMLSAMIYLATEPIPAPPAPPAHHVPTAEELGLRPDPHYTLAGKRVGEEEDEPLS